MDIRPLTTTEQKYTYAQSMQLEGQTGTIGHLRGDFATTGYGFYTTWFDTRPQWKSDEFKADLDTVINALREDKGLLHNRYDMSAFARHFHESAIKGNAGALNKKYRDKDPSANKLLTQNVRIGLDGKKHRRNLNILVCGGSGAGKTRFFCKPNAMQCNTSFVILDPKGEIVRDIGGLLENKGYEVRVLDLINMHRSHCYNPFVYLRNDNDVQRLVTNLFKATTPKGSQSQDPFWDTAASMLLLALVFYLKYEAPPDEQNFPMVMELLRAGEVREDDDSYVSPLDELFDRLEMVNPEHIALKYYRDYHSGSAKTLKSIQITLAARLEKFNLESLAGLAKYQELYLQNEDMVGWISIAGTTINYPVMQSRNNPNFYLKHNFEKDYSDLGTPYVQENCDIAESDNLVIYGHHIKGGKMFGALEDYKSKSFYEEHKTIQFDTLTEQTEYEIVAVFKTVAYSSEGFRYYDFVDAENEEEFNSYVGKCKELALYDTGVTAEYGDRLITLSTCEYSAQNGRLVVVAKKVG